ncbi:MAG: CHAT domain-containing protein [Myxococcaceae bacterium]|nr:CHAT domain-containing protein [Myxococcaceae bacterium]
MRLRLALGVALIAAGVGAAVVVYRPSQRSASCEAMLADRQFADAAEACSREFEARREGALAAAAAMAWLGAGEPDQAWKWANLPEGRDLVRARRVRGVVLKLRGDVEGAQRELKWALSEALETSQHGEASRAAHALAGLQWEHGEYSAAWKTLDLSIDEAKRARDGSALALAELARGDVLRTLGDARGATEYFRRALEDSAAWPNDQLYALLKVGLSERDRGAFALARKHFEKALDIAGSSGNRRHVSGLRVDLAETYALAGEADAAERLLAEVDPSMQREWIVLSLRARIALLRNDAELALRHLAQIDPEQVPEGLRWEVSFLRGRAWWLDGNRREAEEAWQQAIQEVEKLSASEPEYQGWVLARRRKPYDALFSSLASRGEFSGAWEVVARLLLSESLAFKGAEGTDIQRALAAAESLKAQWKQSSWWVPPQSSPAPDPRDILVLHEAEGRLWIGRRVENVVRWIDAGPLQQLDPLLNGFLAAPENAETAEQLGRMLWTTGGLHQSAVPLFVAASGRLRGLPLAALRVDGRYWVELRPIARLPTLTPPGDDPPHFGGAPVVAGDPRGDLPGARKEVEWVAARVGAHPLLGEAVTRKAVLSARGSALLHLATHAEISLEGTRLVLADGDLSAQEILRHRPFARVVVLAACASAAGRDAAGSDSLTTAFLRAGSGAVLGTLRTVPDEAAQQLVRAFYEEGGANDPVGALARAQARVEAYQPVSVWSAFTISMGNHMER